MDNSNLIECTSNSTNINIDNYEIEIKEEPEPTFSTESQESFYLKCGEVFYLEKDNTISFICNICCKKQSLKLSEFLNHFKKCFPSIQCDAEKIIQGRHKTSEENTTNIEDGVITNNNEDVFGAKNLSIFHQKRGEIYYLKSSNTFLFICILCENRNFESIDEFYEHLKYCKISFHHKLEENSYSFAETQIFRTESGNLNEKPDNINENIQYDLENNLCKSKFSMNLRARRKKVYKTCDIDLNDSDSSENNSLFKIKENECVICNKVYPTKFALRRHSVIHGKCKLFKCDKCPKTYNWRSQLNIHLLLHNNKKPYKCDSCQRSFYHSQSLKRHMLIHEEKKYKCNKCDTKFALLGLLKSHKKLHTTEKPYICDVCNKGFVIPSYLIDHMKIHSDEKRFKCHFCEKAFHKSDTLKRHLRTHTGEKPYVCTICEKGFALSSTLKCHTRIHSGERPYKCNYCEKDFKRRESLVSHHKTHTGKNLHSCEFCAKKYCWLSELKKHMRTHTKNQ